MCTGDSRKNEIQRFQCHQFKSQRDGFPSPVRSEDGKGSSQFHGFDKKMDLPFNQSKEFLQSSSDGRRSTLEKLYGLYHGQIRQE